MKKVRVISEFLDKFDLKRTYHVGMEVSFDDARAADVVARHLAEYAEDKKEEPGLFKEETPKVETAEPEVKEPEAPKAEEMVNGEQKAVKPAASRKGKK